MVFTLGLRPTKAGVNAYVYWSGDWCMWFIGFSTDFPSGDSDTGLNEEIVAFFCQCPTPTAHDPID